MLALVRCGGRVEVSHWTGARAGDGLVELAKRRKLRTRDQRRDESGTGLGAMPQSGFRGIRTRAIRGAAQHDAVGAFDELPILHARVSTSTAYAGCTRRSRAASPVPPGKITRPRSKPASRQSVSRTSG